MIILSIETSCDETAAAIVGFKKNKAEVLANVISSQVKAHSKYGGVVPSLASRMHLKNMVPVLTRAFKSARIKKDEIDYIAVTKGPGLIPALIVGTQAAKTLSYALNKPLIGINHIEGHIYANWLKPISANPKPQIPNPKSQTNSKFKIQNSEITEKNKNIFKLWIPEFPMLCLIVSGGHTELILMKRDLDYKIIGKTLDDAAGEAFDKVAKLLGLGYPGGALLEKLAQKGDGNKFKFARPMINSRDYNFSFSGLKTAVLYKMKLETGNWKFENRTKFPRFDIDYNSTNIRPHLTSTKERRTSCQISNLDSDSARFQTSPNPSLSEVEQNILNYQLPITNSKLQISNIQYKADIAASFQQAVIDVLIAKTIAAAKEYKVKNVILGGGVSANKKLQTRLGKAISKELPIANCRLPIASLSTDNALMIAVAAYYRIVNNKSARNWKDVKADANLNLEICNS